MFKDLLLLIFGVFCGSTAVIFIRASTLPTALLSAGRLLVAAAALTPLFLRQWRRHRGDLRAARLAASFIPGLILALHFLTWIAGVRLTAAANATLIVNLVPVAMPFLLYFLAREKITRAELAGTAISLGGVLLLVAADLRLDRTHFFGDLVCFVSMIFFAAYLTLGRRNRGFPSVWLYLVPLYYVAGLACLLASFFFPAPPGLPGAREIALVLGLGLVPTVLGHSILNHAMKRLRGQVVGVVNTGQFIFAGFLAFLFYHELPHRTFYPAALLLVGGAWLATAGNLRLRRGAPRSEERAPADRSTGRDPEGARET